MFERIRQWWHDLTTPPPTSSPPSWAERRVERPDERVVIPEGPDGMEIHDPIAGIVHPHPSGACQEFHGDGRSTICATCDWPEEAHD